MPINKKATSKRVTSAQKSAPVVCSMTRETLDAAVTAARHLLVLTSISNPGKELLKTAGRARSAIECCLNAIWSNPNMSENAQTMLSLIIKDIEAIAPLDTYLSNGALVTPRSMRGFNFLQRVQSLDDTASHAIQTLRATAHDTKKMKCFGSIVRNENWSTFAHLYQTSSQMAFTSYLQDRYSSMQGQANLLENYSQLCVAGHTSENVVCVQVSFLPSVGSHPLVVEQTQQLFKSKAFSQEANDAINTATSVPFVCAVADVEQQTKHRLNLLVEQLKAIVQKENERNENMKIQKEQQEKAAKKVLSVRDALNVLKQNPEMLKKTLTELGLS